jgi:two-component system, NtrC family, sensor kinase
MADPRPPETEAGRLRELEAENARLRAELGSTTRLASLGMLVAGITHELNTPLGALGSSRDVLRRALGRLADILADEVVDESELAEVRRIVRALDDVLSVDGMAVDRLRELVASLRRFGRPDRSEIDMLDVNAALDDALALLRHEMPGGLRVERAYGALPPLECYATQVNQLLMNLVLNAVQAMPDGGTLRLRTRTAHGAVELEVEDTGVGIAEEHLERIFEPGFSTKGGRVGMGLGLLICRDIVDRHGGRLTVRSERGRGSCFRLTLPLRPAPGTASD